VARLPIFEVDDRSIDVEVGDVIGRLKEPQRDAQEGTGIRSITDLPILSLSILVYADPFNQTT
jgi:hypothetical protein